MRSIASAAPIAPARRGRYQLKAEIARGGMGIVYRAYDGLAEREVAYKRLLVPEARARARLVGLFQREYNTLAQLVHPAIVQVYEYGFDEEGPFYTMELLDGEGLLELAPLPANEVCRVLRDTASALALLHARRLLHRDLSPSNVRINRDGRAKLIDFGALVPFGTPPDLVGTPAFMAPECFEGGKLDQRADLYALGALAYWALTRKTAVRARSLADLPTAWLDPIVPPRTLVPEIPKALEELVLSLLARDRLARPASAAEVMERLTAIADLGSEPEEHKVAASYMAHPPLVGRELPIMHLEQALGSVMDQLGASLLLEATPGQGKSALLAEATVRAQLHGATVLRADAGADSASFGLARALIRTVTALHPDLLSTAGGHDSFFQQVLEPRRLARVETAWSPVLASERQARTLALMQEILLRAAAKNPLVIVIDDLHRADAESLALIATLSSECHEHPLLLVLAANQGALDSDAFAKIRSSSREIKLEALSLSGTQELTAAITGGAGNSQRLASWLHERSAGNPARVMDLTRLLLQHGQIHYAAGTFTVPHDVSADLAWEEGSAALLGRLADVGDLARKCAGVLSLQEMPLRVEHVAQAVQAEVREVIVALEQLSLRALVSMSEGGAALLGQSLGAAVSRSLSDTERSGLHLRCARAILAEQDIDGTMRMQAGVHLLKAGEEDEAVTLLTARGDGDFLSGQTPIPLLESVLAVLRRQGRSDEQCLGVLVPLVRGGFFGDLDAQRRHIDCTLNALANVCGVTSMKRLTPIFGKKLAFIFGLLGAVLRHAFTPKDRRYGTFPETVAALLSILSASTAAFTCCFEFERSFEIVRMFEPLRGFGPDSAPYLSMEFCLATAETGAGLYAAARDRYERLLARFARPVQGMDEEIHLQFKQGILHGLAQCKVADADPDCLRLAEELETAHMFFAPHAQTVRMGFYGARGEVDLGEQHRRRGEMLALRGGVSWSSVTIMTVRAAYVALSLQDAVGVVRAIAEFERLSPISPRMLIYRDVMKAGLEQLRGRPQRAVEAYEKLFALPDAQYLTARWIDLTTYAAALSALGRYDDAKRVCDQLSAEGTDGYPDYVKRAVAQQLALIAAERGDLEGAAHALDAVIASMAAIDSPAWLGSVHRARARVALMAKDQGAFEAHVKAMTALFARTRNPVLIQQSELMASAQALSAGTQAVRPVDELALAFENSQARTIEEADHFETEAASMPPERERIAR
jgi:hypothetical protein